MFEYTHEVKDNKGGDWGIFKNEGIASIMRNALAAKFNHVTFYVEPIK